MEYGSNKSISEYLKFMEKVDNNILNYYKSDKNETIHWYGTEIRVKDIIQFGIIKKCIRKVNYDIDSQCINEIKNYINNPNPNFLELLVCNKEDVLNAIMIKCGHIYDCCINSISNICIDFLNRLKQKNAYFSLKNIIEILVMYWVIQSGYLEGLTDKHINGIAYLKNQISLSGLHGIVEILRYHDIDTQIFELGLKSIFKIATETNINKIKDILKDYIIALSNYSVAKKFDTNQLSDKMIQVCDDNNISKNIWFDVNNNKSLTVQVYCAFGYNNDLINEINERKISLLVLSFDALARKLTESQNIKNKIEQDSDKAIELVKKQKVILQSYKAKNKDFQKQLGKSIEIIKKQQVEIENKNKQLESLKMQGITSIEPLEKCISKLNETCNNQENEINTLRRSENKLKELIDKATGEIEIYKLRLNEANSNLEEYRRMLNESSLNIGNSRVSLNSYVKAIRNKRIVIFGGDMMHSELKKLKFNNLKLYKADNRSVDINSLRHSDIIVIVTGYLSHATCSIPKIASERFGISVHYFNNKNIVMLIEDLFEYFYG